MADSLGDLGWPVEDRILVLNVLRGLSDRYSYLRTWITRQRLFPIFLQVRDDLVMEELTQGLQPGSTPAGVLVLLDCSRYYSSASSRRPTTVVTSWSSSPRAERGWGGAVAAAVAVMGDVEQVVGAARHLHEVHPGHPSTTHGQGASPCGRSRLPVASLGSRRPWSRVLPRGSSQ